MRVVFDIDGRYDRTPDGSVWSKSGCGYAYWKRLLDVFDRVTLVARVRDVPEVPPDWKPLTGERVSVAGVPYFLGPWQYLKQARQVTRIARSIVEPGDAVVLSSGVLSFNMACALRATGYPYAMRVIGDPYDVFAPGSVRHPLRPYFRWLFSRQLRGMCGDAMAAVYVTREALQKRYPCPAYSVGVSDVDLPDDALASAPRPARPKNAPLNIVMVGTLAQLYKAPDAVVSAVAECARGGLDVRVTFVGDGKYRPMLEATARQLGLNGQAVFRGQLPNAQVRTALDEADLFVLPSRQEGLPRAMVEAMARGLPCIGSTVGGIPELIAAEDMVPPGDAVALASKIREVIADPRRLELMSRRNLQKAHEYRESVLREQWDRFYRYVREGTEQWMKTANR